MNLRTGVLIAAAILIGLVAASVVRDSLNASAGARGLITVVSAAEDLSNFDLVRRASIAPRDLPKSDFDVEEHFLWPSPAGKSSRAYEEELDRMAQQVCGRTVLYGIRRGEVITDSMLADRDAGKGLAAMIPPGKRAITIQLSPANSAVADYLWPHNRVDLLVTTPPKQRVGEGATTILQSVEVLAIDRSGGPGETERQGVQPRLAGSSGGGERPASVTLLLSPQEVETLEHHKATGTVSLSVRNSSDTKFVGSKNEGAGRESGEVERLVETPKP